MDSSHLIEELKKVGSERILLFWGSGLVKDLGYPTWPELLHNAAAFVRTFQPSLADLIDFRTGQGDLFGAGDLLFEKEFPRSKFAEFMYSTFDKSPTLFPVHCSLVSCPFAAFITTNFDRTIEQSLTANKKVHESISGVNRFSSFNSRLSVYCSPPSESDKRGHLRVRQGLVLKLHGDVTTVEDIVLGSRQLESLAQNGSFNHLYWRILSSYTVLFVGFSANDPNLERHCRTLVPACGIQPITSYLLHPVGTAPPAWLGEGNVVPVPISPDDNFKELADFAADLAEYFTEPNVLAVRVNFDPLTDAKLNSLALTFTGLSQGQHTTSFQCAVDSMVAQAAISTGSLDDNDRIAEYLSRTYSLPIRDAGQIVEKSDKFQIQRLIDKQTQSEEKLQSRIELLATGISTRAKALGVLFSNGMKLNEILMRALVEALSSYGNALAFSLMDAEPPDATMVDKLVRDAIANLTLPGVGPYDKEILVASFADLFIHPTDAEAETLLVLSETAVAHALAVTFSGGLRGLSEYLPDECGLDSNVSLPLIARDHPRSAYYNELVVQLIRSGASVYLLDLFLNEMVHHCRLAFEEINQANIKTPGDAKSYAEFHGILWINVFIAAYANGGRSEEKFSEYIERILGASNPKEGHFAKVLESLGVEVLSTRNLEKSESEELAVHIAAEKGRIMRLKAQSLAEHEACQILWLHKRNDGQVWFITEDATLRRILRELPSVRFSTMPPSKGVVPAQGAFLLFSSLSERPSLQGSFVKFLWNPLYVELVDSMLSSVIRTMPEHVKALRHIGFAELRDKITAEMQKEMERSEKNDIVRRVKQYKLGRPEIVQSILRALGEEQ